jgi:hypothetical protein
LKARFFKKAFSDTPFLAIAMITLTALITHGLMIPRLGYYYDDWYMLWSGAARGAASLIPLFSMDRPFMGVIYSIFYRVIRDYTIGWHVFALLLRIAGGIAFYWILNLAWPKLKKISVFAAMLFVVFPGFLAEPNAATKVNHLIGYASALFSIALTLQAVNISSRSWRYACTGLSLLLMAFYIWIYEYMVGLEVMRILLLYWMSWQGEKEKAIAATKKVFLAYIPYGLVTVLFVFWRIFIFHSTRPATDLKGLVTDYQSDFVSMVLRVLFQVVKDFFSASTFAWLVQAYHLFDRAEFGEIIVAFMFGLVMVLLAVWYFFIVRKSESNEQENLSPFIIIIIGAIITLGAVFPVVMLNRHIDLMDPYKGYALHPSAGVIILVIGIIAMMKPKFRIPTLIALLALAVVTQAMNIQYWSSFWETERNMWWQLTWRAPNFRDYTLVMAYLPNNYSFQQDYEIWGPVNLIYRPKEEHWPHIESEVLNQDTSLLISEGKVTETHVRDIYLPRDYRNFLLISQPTTRSCIHVIDGKMPAYSANERLLVQKVGQYSNVDLIDPSGTPPVPPGNIFGKEPEQGWCYYFQQASLARQVGDWGKVGKLYDTLSSTGLKAGDASEYFVFIEGLVNLGRVEEAGKIVNDMIKENEPLKFSLCTSLSSAPEYPKSYGYRLQQIKDIVCK